MALSRSQFAINTLQWTDLSRGWEFADPDFRRKQPCVLREVVESGFPAVMLEVLPTQTIHSYRRLVAETGLRVAPGYVQIPLPETHGVRLESGSLREFHWFDTVRRRADESLFFGLDVVFLAPEMFTDGGMPRFDVAAAAGVEADRGRLERYTDLIGRAAEILVAEGVRPALHNHVGSWIETQDEVEFVLDAIPDTVLGTGLDLGHLYWAGADIPALLAKYRDRTLGLHIKDLDVDRVASQRRNPLPYPEATSGAFFLEPGLGEVPLLSYLDTLPETFDGWIIVEVDQPSMEPLPSARTSWAWVEKHFAP